MKRTIAYKPEIKTPDRLTMTDWLTRKELPSGECHEIRLYDKDFASAERLTEHELVKLNIARKRTIEKEL